MRPFRAGVFLGSLFGMIGVGAVLSSGMLYLYLAPHPAPQPRRLFWVDFLNLLILLRKIGAGDEI